MKTILKFEFNYLFFASVSVFSVLLGIYVYSFFSNISILNFSSYAAALFLFVQAGSTTNKESRLRLFVPLSLSLCKIAVSRAVIILLIYLIIFGTANIFHLFFKETISVFTNGPAELNMFGAEVLLMIFTYLILTDTFPAFSSKNMKWIINAVFLTLIVVMMVLSAVFISSTYGENKTAGIILILISYIAALILAGISVFTFEHRESYN